MYRSANDHSTKFASDTDVASLPHLPMQVSVLEVNELLRRLKKKSPGPDGLPVWVFKTFSVCLPPSSTFIFNRSLNEGHVPLCFKEDLITPVPKVVNPNSATQFRPISLLLISKVLENLSLDIGSFFY